MFDLSETATVWVMTRDAFGETSAARHTVASRHAQKQERFTDSNGNDAISSAVLYFESDVPKLGSFVVFRDDAALTPASDAYEIKALCSTPSSTNIKKAWL